MDPTFTALFLVLALASFVVAIAISGPGRWRSPGTYVALGLALWLLPSVWAAVSAA